MNLFNMLIFSGLACFASSSIPSDQELAAKLEDLGFDVELEDGYVNFLEGDCGKLKGDAILSQLKHVKIAVLENIDVETLSTISQWRELQKLELKSCKLKRLDEIGQISSLESFLLESEQSEGQTDTQFLKLLPKLRRIYLKGNTISKFEAVSLEWLRGLSFENTSISDFSFLGRCQRLRGLVIKTNQMNIDLSEISKLKKLDGLIVDGPVAMDFPIKSNLFKLEIRGASRFTDEIGLERMSNLISLTLKNTKVAFGANSFKLPGSIQNLVLDGVPTQDLSVLGKLPKLTSLHVPVQGTADGRSGFHALQNLVLNSEKTTGVIGFRGIRRLSIDQTSIAMKDLPIRELSELEAIGLNPKQKNDLEWILDSVPDFKAEIRLTDWQRE